MAILEYVWLDGYDVKNIRSKIKIEPNISEFLSGDPNSFPEWGFDGSSTNQAEGSKSDCILKPVYVCENQLNSSPLRTHDHDYFIVLCEVMNPDGTPHETNTRAKMMEAIEPYSDQVMWFGMEQEYTIYEANGKLPYRWPSDGFPEQQGRFYCGNGADVAWGRDISNEHLEVCLQTGLPISGTNAEVMPSQWEFQIGPACAPRIADEMWVARFLLNRVAERYGAMINYSPKPMKGDWNGAGCHVNFSTEAMRDSLDIHQIGAICKALEESHSSHIEFYGKNNAERLTGKHETCDINQFRYGVSDRGASIRIPPSVAKNGMGYLEDRRPAANMDPYEVCRVLTSTVCSVSVRRPILVVK